MNGFNIKFSGKSDNITQKNCVIGLDRDGTLNKLPEDYVKNANEWIPIPGSLEAIAKLRNSGYSIVILSNQGGIEKGIMTIDDVEAVHKKMFSLLGQAGCASIDLGLILQKQKLTLEDYSVEVTAERNDNVAKNFKSINLHFNLTGDLDDSKVARAIDLTLTKYCSVALSLDKEIKITSSYKIK